MGKRVYYKVLGVGYNDLKYKYSNDKFYTKALIVWQTMIRRCYSDKYKKNKPSYIGCVVSKEWLTFSTFYDWYIVNYTNGYVLDKDILVKGNKVYSSDTCCFVPPRINSLFIKSNRSRGKYPIGVYFNQGKYKAQLNKMEENQISLGVFNCPIDAFNAYKEAKESYIKMMADKWKDKIKPKVYNAMYNYKVEITD